MHGSRVETPITATIKLTPQAKEEEEEAAAEAAGVTKVTITLDGANKGTTNRLGVLTNRLGGSTKHRPGSANNKASTNNPISKPQAGASRPAGEIKAILCATCSVVKDK